jgi:hypothetical protein
LPRFKVLLEALPLVSMAEHTLAEAVRITTDPMAAAAVRRFRVCGGYGGRAKGYGDSKPESVFAHSLVLSLLRDDGKTGGHAAHHASEQVEQANAC